MAKEILIGFAIIIARILASVVMSAGAVYAAMALFDGLTASIEEWKEMKKGNLAVGLLFSSVIISMMLLIEPRITDFAFAIQAPSDALPAGTIILVLAFTLINYLAGLFAGTVLLFLAVNVIDRITPDLDELAELKKGNLAVALVLAIAVLLVVFVAREPFEFAFDSLIALESAFIPA